MFQHEIKEGLKLYESGYVVLMCLENGDFIQMVIKASEYKKIDK